MHRKCVVAFGGGKTDPIDENRDPKDLLGGKGAGLVEMTALGISVPPGFVITTDVCRDYYRRKHLSQVSWEQVREGIVFIERHMGSRFGDANNPLLVSVRSGARASMPGMMDTVLNVGLNDVTVKGLANRTKNERFALDTYRRFIAMYGSIVMGVERGRFEDALKQLKAEVGAKEDVDLGEGAMRELVARYKIIIRQEIGDDLPQDPWEQLKMAINAVFTSWYGDRAVTYRRLNGIPDDWGTAVNVVAMVFGNMGERSGTGVMFTKNPATGEPAHMGEFLFGAQGEDVVAGIRTPFPLSVLAERLPEVHEELMRTVKVLEKYYRDMLDLEFTIQEGKLFMLQVRVGKRTGIAAVRIAIDLHKKANLISKEEAVARIRPEDLSQYLYPIFDPAEREKHRVIGKGLPAGPGAATGQIALTPERAVEMKAEGKAVILVRQETSPDDIHGMHASEGFLTARGGMTSHAAVVARQMGKVCVAGCEAVSVDLKSGAVLIGNISFAEGDFLSIDGFTGEVFAGKVPVIDSEVIQVIQGRIDRRDSEKYQRFALILAWADDIRRLRVRANADLPDQAAIARGFGAEGIGLCRTEHMFFANDRIQIMQNMILARSLEEREGLLERLLPLQKADFIGLYVAMGSHPVTIRLLDPPLHEFLPKREELIDEIARLETQLQMGYYVESARQEKAEAVMSKRKLLERVEELHEANPMLGMRGCRLGIMMPEITRMQVRAIIQAACDVRRTKGIKVVPEIMVPLVGSVGEMRAQKQLVAETAEAELRLCGMALKFVIGTMIELPRAAMTADSIAKEAEFFSFGTNDLTQTTFGFSRDDAARFIDFYLRRKDSCPACLSEDVDWKETRCRNCETAISERAENILGQDPFAVLDQEGVGEMMKIAIERGRKTRPKIKLGICGEHGGEPASIEFCHRLDLDYVSCSPYRVPIARLAAAQAVIRVRNKSRVH